MDQAWALLFREETESPEQGREGQVLQVSGKPYDLAFKFNNGKYYCSELVWLIYKEQFGVELCKPRKIKEYNLVGIRKHLTRRGMNENQLVVAPSDLL